MRKISETGCLVVAVAAAVGVVGMPAALEAGAWTLPKGKIWTKLAFYSLKTTQQFAENSGILPSEGAFKSGDKIPFFNDGKSTSRAAFLDVYYGLTDRVDLGVQVPFYAQSFVDNVTRSRRQDTDRSGFSDIMATVKARLLNGPLVTTVIGQVKFPTGEFVNIDGVVPVGEGQADLTVKLSLGYSLWPRPGYTNLEVGWRFRAKNTSVDFDPGDEFVFLWEAGYDLHPRVQAAVKVSGLYGRPARFGLSFVTNRRQREILYVSPEVNVRLTGNVLLSAGLNVPLQGRTYPAGEQYFLGLATTL